MRVKSCEAFIRGGKKWDEEQRDTSAVKWTKKERRKNSKWPWCRYMIIPLWGKCLHVPTQGEKCLCLDGSFLHSFICILSFQNDHELQPEGDPSSSIRSEPTPTLHVSKKKQSLFDNHVPHAFKRFSVICDAWHPALYGCRWVSAEQKMMQLIEIDSGKNCVTAISVATATHLKWDIHYLPWIIGFLSAPRLCASVEQHAKYAVPFSLQSPNGQFVQEAEHQRAGRRTK